MNQGLIVVDTSHAISGYTTSPPICMNNYYALNIQINGTGSNVNGTFSLQTSLDYQPGGNGNGGGPAPNAGTWVTYTNSSQVVSGTPIVAWDIFGTAARWFRVNWAYSSGTGTITNILAQLKG